MTLISIYNINNRKMNITGSSGCINVVKLQRIIQVGIKNVVVDHINRVTGLKGIVVRTCMGIFPGENTGHDNKLTALTK